MHYKYIKNSIANDWFLVWQIQWNWKSLFRLGEGLYLGFCWLLEVLATQFKKKNQKNSQTKAHKKNRKMKNIKHTGCQSSETLKYSHRSFWRSYWQFKIWINVAPHHDFWIFFTVTLSRAWLFFRGGFVSAFLTPKIFCFTCFSFPLAIMNVVACRFVSTTCDLNFFQHIMKKDCYTVTKLVHFDTNVPVRNDKRQNPHRSKWKLAVRNVLHYPWRTMHSLARFCYRIFDRGCTDDYDMARCLNTEEKYNIQQMQHNIMIA